jgi:two-component system nitrogen regulation response regulator GlnG
MPTQRHDVISRSASMRRLDSLLQRIAPSRTTVLIEGESGAGKEVAATRLHVLSGRHGPLVAINCGSMSPELLDSELFGHTRGAFTGASQGRDGLILHADGGTLFLDEIGELPLFLQAKLLRVLETASVRPVGTDAEVPVDLRVIAATNRPMAQLVEDGHFREDLYYRLNVLALRVPPLRERVEDIPDLVRHFFQLVEKEGLPRKQVDSEAMDVMRRYRWPGNVRELENLVRRLAALYPQETITAPIVEAELQPASAPASFSGSTAPERSETLSASVERHLGQYFVGFGDNIPPPGLYHRILREVEPPLIAAALAATRGNQIRAAELLGLNRNTLRKKIRELDMQVVRSSR